MRFYHLRIYINEIGFHANKTSELETSSIASRRSWYYSISRNEILIRCLQASRDYLDRYLLLTPEDQCSFTMIEFMNLVYVVLLLGDFATGICDSPSLDVAYIKETVNLEYYLDALSGQVYYVVSCAQLGTGYYLNDLAYFLQKSKDWYNRVTADPVGVGQGAVGPVSFSFMEILPMIVSRCHDPFEMTSDVSTVSPDEQWVEMLSSWAIVPS